MGKSPWDLWSSEQVRNLWEFQRSDRMHPFTCPNRGDGAHFEVLGDLGTLIPTRGGWICLSCDYTQHWAHDFMLDGSALHAPDLLK